jgi:broad specificity phosphatase PhoE
LIIHAHTGLHKEAEGLPPEQVGLGGTLWFCRHAEVHNPRQVLYGRLPRFRLTPYGHQQAAQLGTFLAPQPLTTLYTSPLLRARQTAQVIIAARPGLKARTDQLLIEVDTGHDGVPLAQIGDFNFYEPLAHPQDETIENVRDRILMFVRRAIRRHHGQMIAAVSHGDPVVILHAHYFGLPMRLASLRSPNFYPERTSVTRYDFPPEGFTLDPSRVRISYYVPPF